MSVYTTTHAYTLSLIELTPHTLVVVVVVVVDYDRFSLYVRRSAVSMDNGGIGDDDMDIVDTSDFESELFPSNQALLVRPDGHVAWRGTIDQCDGRQIHHALNSILCPESS